MRSALSHSHSTCHSSTREKHERWGGCLWGVYELWDVYDLMRRVSDAYTTHVWCRSTFFFCFLSRTFLECFLSCVRQTEPKNSFKNSSCHSRRRQNPHTSQCVCVCNVDWWRRWLTVCVCVCVCVSMYVCMYVCVCVFICVCVYVCMCVCVTELQQSSFNVCQKNLIANFFSFSNILRFSFSEYHDWGSRHVCGPRELVSIMITPFLSDPSQDPLVIQ